MSQAGQKTALPKIEAPLLSLQNLEYSFSRTIQNSQAEAHPSVGDCILTQAETMELYESARLNAENIGRLTQ